LEIIADSRTGLGPIGGIESGTAYFAGQSDAVMFVPSDTPNLTAKEFSALKKAFLETKAPVVFAQTTGFFSQPLCAVVHNGLRETIASAIDGGQRKIQNVAAM
jgi:molybdopterin-guanine dinucleotide biosynthesis protein A